MAIEIRELIIKTVVQTDVVEEKNENSNIDTQVLRSELLEECRKMIQENKQWGSQNR